MVHSFTFKVLIAGPFGVGKTTLIQQISCVPVVGTEVATSGEEARVKRTTTVGIEYGVFSLTEEDLAVELLLFGTPGQERFAAARAVAARGMDGLIVLVDATEPATWPEARSLLEALDTAATPTLLVLNRRPHAVASTAAVVLALGLPEGTAVTCGDVIDPDDARRFMVELLGLVLEAEDGLDLDEDPPEHRREDRPIRLGTR